MGRWIDTVGVLLFISATAFVAAYSRGGFGAKPDAAANSPEESYAARVATALPRLERHVASGSMRSRELACDERKTTAAIDELEAAIGAADDPALSQMLARGIAALRECVACTPVPHGCAAAARAFTDVEQRLALPRGASGT